MLNSDDVSVVLNYRTQFANVLSPSSYADLVKRIKSNVQQSDVDLQV